MPIGATRKTMSAQMFQQIIYSLKSDGGRRFNEQRAQPRVGVRGRLMIRPILAGQAGETSLEVWVRDVSADGIGILHNEPFATGTRLVAEFSRQDDDSLLVTYSVAHSKLVSGGLYLIGAQLIDAGKNPPAGLGT